MKHPVPDLNLIYYGKPVWQWLQVYLYCHVPTGMGGMALREFPDGNPLNDQPNYLIEMFGLISEELGKYNKRNSK